MSPEFLRWKIVEQAPATALMSKAAYWKLRNKICKSINRSTRRIKNTHSNTATNIIWILKMRVDKSKWPSRTWKKWTLRRRASMSTWPNQCINLCKLSPLDTHSSIMPSTRRKCWIRTKNRKFRTVNRNQVWSSKRTMMFRRSLAPPRPTLASFPSLKRSRQTTSQLMIRSSHFNFNRSSPQWRNSITKERQRNSLKCQAATIRHKQVKLRMVSKIRHKLSCKIKMLRSRGGKIRRRYPQMNSIKLTKSARPRRKSKFKQMWPKRIKRCRSPTCLIKVRCLLTSLIAHSKKVHKRPLMLQNLRIRTRYSFKIVRKMIRNRKLKSKRSSKWWRIKT